MTTDGYYRNPPNIQKTDDSFNNYQRIIVPKNGAKSNKNPGANEQTPPISKTQDLDDRDYISSTALSMV